MLDADRIYQQLIDAGEDWADKDAAASILEETKKTVLASLMQEAEASTMAAKEATALSSPVYGLHLTRMVEARREANRARVRYDSAKTLSELRRSQESTRRAEVKLA